MAARDGLFLGLFLGLMVTGLIFLAVGIHPKARWSGDVFRDCGECPAMVVVPAGEFVMGSPPSEEHRKNNEGPQNLVTIGEMFAVGKYEVTVGEYRLFVRESGHRSENSCTTFEDSRLEARFDRSWESPGFRQSERDPVVCVSWGDARSYVKWLSVKTGSEYRLLSEAEWEYVARAGTTTAYNTGPRISTDQANFDGRLTFNGSSRGIFRGQTTPVGSFVANQFGLHDVHGNVWEWVQDCANNSYVGMPKDGKAWLSGDCSHRIVRGGSWNNFSLHGALRSASRLWGNSGSRYNDGGFRVARTL